MCRQAQYQGRASQCLREVSLTTIMIISTIIPVIMIKRWAMEIIARMMPIITTHLVTMHHSSNTNVIKTTVKVAIILINIKEPKIISQYWEEGTTFLT